MRRARGLQVVAIDSIVGTVRHPSQNTADFQPLPQLRGRNWMGRWRRILAAIDRMVTLPAIELVQVGDEYYVTDGHNRVAAARHTGAVTIDADVVELIIPGVDPGSPQRHVDASTLLVGTDELRQAASGRPQSRTSQRRTRVDNLRRKDLLEGDTE